MYLSTVKVAHRVQLVVYGRAGSAGDKMTQAKPLWVAFGVVSVCGVAAIPLWFQSVRKREQLLAQARYAVFLFLPALPSCSVRSGARVMLM